MNNVVSQVTNPLKAKKRVRKKEIVHRSWIWGVKDRECEMMLSAREKNKIREFGVVVARDRR